MNSDTLQTSVEVKTVTPEAEGETEVNIYPILRSVFLILAVVTFIAIILFLLYLNGKSVYESGV
jgi:hypothetical protein